MGSFDPAKLAELTKTDIRQAILAAMKSANTKSNANEVIARSGLSTEKFIEGLHEINGSQVNDIFRIDLQTNLAKHQIELPEQMIGSLNMHKRLKLENPQQLTRLETAVEAFQQEHNIRLASHLPTQTAQTAHVIEHAMDTPATAHSATTLSHVPPATKPLLAAPATSTILTSAGDTLPTPPSADALTAATMDKMRRPPTLASAPVTAEVPHPLPELPEDLSKPAANSVLPIDPPIDRTPIPQQVPAIERAPSPAPVTAAPLQTVETATENSAHFAPATVTEAATITPEKTETLVTGAEATTEKAAKEGEGLIKRIIATAKAHPKPTIAAAALATAGLGYVALHEKRQEAPMPEGQQR